MARRQLTPDDLDALRTLAQQLGKVVAKRASGPKAPALMSISPPWKRSPLRPPKLLPRALSKGSWIGTRSTS